MAASGSKRARKANWAKSEVCRLIEEVSQKQNILFSKFKTSDTNKKKKVCWGDMLKAVSSSDCSVTRTVDEVSLCQRLILVAIFTAVCIRLKRG